MPRRSKSTSAQGQLGFRAVEPGTAPCVPNIREAVKQWREAGYPGVTDTTRILLNYWFKTEHRLPGNGKFEYHYFQREAMETLIYLYEVKQLRRQKTLLEQFSPRQDIRLLQFDDFARYCVKMATGSGKTKVMSLAIAWQFFNAVAEGREDYAKSFLLIAPNVIVYERLKSDFAGGRIFRADPIIPPQLTVYWDFQCYMREEGERASSLGALYVTNVQQLYTREEASNEPDVMTAVLGAKPSSEPMTVEPIADRICKRREWVMVMNDEAHHTHDEDSEWNKAIRQLHTDLSTSQHGVHAQLDFTATPRHTKGALFSWTVYDYPLKQAIIDGVVKRPIKGIASGIKERPSDVASTRYQAFVTAGVERWREYVQQLKPLHRKPVLFLMLNNTEDAEDVADWLRTTYTKEFGGENDQKKLLVIHTDTKGEISKKDLDVARKVAREVDAESSLINCIVSVLMLREGWDVQNVTVVVGLRPYSAKANILPEQTIGRGLRLMFRDMAPQYRERVDVIGNKGFIEFLDQLQKEEELDLETFEVGKDKLEIVTIVPDPAKMDKDIAIPQLTPILTRKKSLTEEIMGLDVGSFQAPILPLKQSDKEAQTFHYEGYDFITLEKEVEREYSIPEPQTAEEVIGYYARRIAQELKLPSQFASLAPKVREFFQRKAFGREVNLEDKAVVKAMSSNVAYFVTVKTFVAALRDKLILQQQPQLAGENRSLSQTPPFPYSRPTLKASKTVFNLVPCDNEFEKEFAKFLEDAPDVVRFAKLPSQVGFAIEYTDGASNLRYYEPDFVAVSEDGRNLILETKGQEGTEVPYKNRAAMLWCEYATQLTGQMWEFRIVRQKEYEKLQPDRLADLDVLIVETLQLHGS
jgi:type III restriction enzyme